MVPNSANQSAQAQLKRFVQFGDQRAFAEIIRTHADLVYSAALRLLGEHRHAADDVAQTVFSDLSAKAGSFPEDIALAGWLHQHTCFVAKKALRTELRRLRREDTAHAMTISDDASDALWLQVRPLLDDALGELTEADRHALVLRFLQGRPFKSVAETLSTSEDAARMRVGRALNRLREVLAKRGVHTTSDALDGALANYAVVAAPAALIAVITASTATAAITTALPILTAMKAAKVAVAALVIAGGVLLVRDYQENARLRDELAQFRSLQAELDKLQEEKDRLAARVPSIDEVNAARRSLDELQRLRLSEKSLFAELTKAQTKTTKESVVAVSTNYPSEFRVRKNQGVTTLTPGHVLATWQFDEESKRCLLFLIQPIYEPEGGLFTLRTKAVESDWTDPTRSPLEGLELPNSSAQWSEKTLSPEAAEELVKSWQNTVGIDVLSAPTMTTLDRKEATIQINQMKEWQGTNYPVGLTFKLWPAWNAAAQNFTDAAGAPPKIRLGWSAEVAELRKEFEPPKPSPKPEE